MISCIEWIPRNVADPKPKRYELSKAERELLAQDAAAEQIQMEQEEDDDVDHDGNMNVDAKNDNGQHVPKVSAPSEGTGAGEKKLTATEIIASQQIDPSALPKEFRMDEYSDDENDNNNSSNPASNIGDLLIGNDEAGMMGIDEHGNVEDHVEDESEDGNEFDDDDDLNDVPDTREYAPTDLKGLEAMSFGGYAGMKEFEEAVNEDDDSDVEDTNLKSDDALVIVAKTEEVSD